MSYYSIERSSSLEHHGVKGMKWGVRRYQDYDGHLIGSKKLKPKPRLFGLFNKKNKSRTDLGSKVPEKNDKASKYKEYEQTLKDDGWKRNDKYSYGDSTDFDKTIKVGGETVEVSARCDRTEDVDAFRTRINESLASITKANDSIKKSVLNEAYKEFQSLETTNGVTKAQFEKGLKLSFIDLGKSLNEVWYDDYSGLSGGHSFTAEVDDKGKYYRYSMNG